MKNSAQKIRISHVGRLPVPQGFEQTALRLAFTPRLPDWFGAASRSGLRRWLVGHCWPPR